MRHWGFILAAFAALSATRAQDVSVLPGERFDPARPEIRAFIDDVVGRGGPKRAEIERLLRRAVPQPKIIEAMTRPAEKVSPWWQYRAHFLTEERIHDGVTFWETHRDALERIAAERGVAPEYIVAIIGIETFYGRNAGHYRVIDALATLAFNYPPRGEFFRSELEQFLLLTHEEKIDPLTTVGSYAGAMGASQFMPSSYRHYAIDEDGDGRRDLWRSWEDVFASIANYFRQHGWQPGAPVLVETTLAPEPNIVADPRNLELNDTVEGLRAKGVEFEVGLTGGEAAMLVPAEQEDGPSYRVGFRNFEVITRYNRSIRYAMAVHELAMALAARVHPAIPTPIVTESAAPLPPVGQP